MNSLEKQLISECDAFIEKQEFEKAMAFLDNYTVSFLTTWLRGKVYLCMAESMSRSFSFQYYATQEMKMTYRNIIQEAINHLFSTVMGLTDASTEWREYLNNIIWKQMGQAENELAKTSSWFPQPEEKDDFEEDPHWADGNNLSEYLKDLNM